MPKSGIKGRGKPDIGLNRELARQAANLEERLRLLRVPTRKIPRAQWATLPPEMKTAIPTWITLLLSRYSLANAVLEYPDRIETYSRYFRFAEPEDYKLLLEKEALWWELWEAGFVPFAWESDGDVWVLDGRGSQSGKVYLWDHSGCSPNRPPSLDNGLRLASSRLEFLFASMAVSTSGYQGVPKCVMWHDDSERTVDVMAELRDLEKAIFKQEKKR